MIRNFTQEKFTTSNAHAQSNNLKKPLNKRTSQIPHNIQQRQQTGYISFVVSLVSKAQTTYKFSIDQNHVFKQISY